jgi:G3E family GTPase
MRQLIYADKILLNKVDLISPTDKLNQIEYIKEIIEKVNPTAQITESFYSNIALDFFIEKNPFCLKEHH